MTPALQPGATRLATPLGTYGIAWTKRGLDRVQLPEQTPEATEAALRARLPERPWSGRPPEPVRGWLRRLRRHLSGRSDALEDVPCDLTEVTPFARRVYRRLRRVPPGTVVTYQELARHVGRPGAARAVGRAMATNPIPLVIPCHRVVTAEHGLGGFAGRDGVALKARLLFIEGVVLDPEVQRGLDHLRRVDPRLRRIIPRIGPYQPRGRPRGDAYEMLALSILYQQLAGPAAAAIERRVRALTKGPRFPRPEEILRLSERRLRAAGLSRQKLSYLKDLAGRIADGRLVLRHLGRRDDEAVIASLCQVKGVGRWTAQMFLMFHLERLDVLPVDDLGLQKGVQITYQLKQRPAPAEVAEIGERWRPYRSIGSWYMWQNLGAGGI